MWKCNRVVVGRVAQIACIAVVATSIALALSSQPALAYNLEDPIWYDQPSPGNCCAFLYPYIGFGVHSYDVTGWQNGMNAWTSSPAYIGYYQGGPSSVITLSDYYDSGSNDAGVTDSVSSGSYFSQANAFLNYYWTSQWQSTPGKIQATATHELGHVAGLAHTTTECVIMNPSMSEVWDACGIDTPQPDDDNGINAMY